MQLDSSVESILLEPFMPNTIAGNIVIAELMYDSIGADTNLEWILLYNPTNSPIDLTGWRLQAGGAAPLSNHGTNMAIEVGKGSSGSTTVIVQPFSYYLIGESLVPGVDYISNVSFQNAGSFSDGIRIIDNLGTVVDTILYDAPNTNDLPDGPVLLPGQPVPPGTSFAPDTDTNSGDSLQRKSNSTGYVSGQGNGYQTGASGNDFIIRESGGVPIVPRNSTSPPERFTGEINEGNNYLPTFVNTSKRGPSTSLGFWQIGSNEQHGFTHAPVFKMVFADIAEIITQGAPTDPGVTAPLNEISGIKIWGVGNINDDGVVFPLNYLSNNPKLDIYLNKFQFVNNDGEARLPIERTDVSGPPHGGAPVNFNITGYKKKTFPITF